MLFDVSDVPPDDRPGILKANVKIVEMLQRPKPRALAHDMSLRDRRCTRCGKDAIDIAYEDSRACTSTSPSSTSA